MNVNMGFFKVTIHPFNNSNPVDIRYLISSDFMELAEWLEEEGVEEDAIIRSIELLDNCDITDKAIVKIINHPRTISIIAKRQRDDLANPPAPEAIV